MRHISVIQSQDGTKYAVAINHAPGLTILHEGATKEEAVEKYRQELLSHWQGFTSDDEQHKCVVCGEWTSSYATVPDFGHQWWLCSKHETDEDVDRLFTISPDFQVWTS